MFRVPILFFAAVATLSTAVAADPSPSPVTLQPFPTVTACAAKQGIPLNGFDLVAEGNEARIGDRITVLFTIQESATSRQWLAEFRRAPLTEREKNSKPGSGLGIFSVFLSSLKTDTGHEYGFQSTPAALELRVFGPFSDGPASMEAAAITGVTARALASREYLAHGLAVMCEIEMRLRDAGKKDPGLSYMFHPRYSAEQMTGATQRAQAAGFTPDDERVFAEGYFALVQFAQLAFRTEGIASITREILDSPTLFSGAFINPDWSGLELATADDWALPGVRIFRVPYVFRSKTQARGQLFVTEPRPPLQNIAGIVGLVIDWSSKTPDKRLVMRVVAGRRASP